MTDIDWLMATIRSPVPLRRSVRKSSADRSDLARDAASSLLRDTDTETETGGEWLVVGNKAKENVSPGGDKAASQDPALLSGRDERKVQKLDGKAYKPWGTRSRSSSDAGSDTAFCKGGPGKEVCGEPVRSSDNGILCDRCDQWFHASCQEIPKPAYDALVKYKVLSWLCPDCKKSVKINDGKRMLSLETRVEQLDKAMRNHAKLVTQSLKEQEVAVDNQTKLLERSIRELHNQKTSYADMVKGTCSEVVDKVSAKISSIPQGQSAQTEPRNMIGISRVFDDFLDKDRRKNNLVIHNLPETAGLSKEDRSTHDMRLFQDLIKETFLMNVAVARSFRVGKSVEGRDRLLIVTLETPGVKQDILRLAPQLRSSEKYGNIYITPDLTPAEREAAKKLRDELSARRKAGEVNLTIRRGKIVKMNTNVGHAKDSESGPGQKVSSVQQQGQGQA